MAKRSNGRADGAALPARRRWPSPDEPLSTRATDPEEFRERVQAEAVRRLGGRLEEVISDPDLREVMYNVYATALRASPRPIPLDTLELVEQLNRSGLVVRPGHGDLSDMPEPMDLGGVSLSEAILEERWGTDYTPPKRRR